VLAAAGMNPIKCLVAAGSINAGSFCLHLQCCTALDYHCYRAACSATSQLCS
jgi:hypothetical protein